MNLSKLIKYALLSAMIISSSILTIKSKYSLNKPYIICVSSFSERKNQKRLVEAFQQLGLKDYELVLVGGKSKYADNVNKVSCFMKTFQIALASRSNDART